MLVLYKYHNHLIFDTNLVFKQSFFKKNNLYIFKTTVVDISLISFYLVLFSIFLNYYNN